MAGVFLNFRSTDAGSYAAVYLDDVLTRLLGPELVFRSSRSIPAGSAFDAELLAALGRVNVLLALIGPDWMTPSDGVRAIDRPDDWVRREIAVALQRGIHVIPVLLTGAARPTAADLPAEIASLALRQAVYLRHRHIGPDVRHLLDELVRVAPELSIAGMFAATPTLPESFVPSMLLRPEYAVVPFAGRDSELAQLQAWAMADTPAAPPVRLITGPGGQGKTRLALRLCDVLREQGWFAGIVADGTQTDVLARVTELPGPLLIVVDYAEAHTDALLAIAEAAGRRLPERGPWRLLMLARSGGEWLRSLHDHGDDAIASLFLSAIEQQLPPLAAKVVDRFAEFVRAMSALAYRMGLSAEGIEAPTDLADDRYERVLDVHASALACLLDDVDDGPSASDPRWDPVVRVLHHERRYWQRTMSVFEIADVTRRQLDGVVAASTLFGAADERQAVDLLSLLPAFEGTGPDVVRRCVVWAGALYPGSGALNPLRPDRLGEDQAAALGGDLSFVPAAAVQVDDERLRQALTVLSRAAPRHEPLTTVLTSVATTQSERFVRLSINIAQQLEDPRPLVRVLTTTVSSDTPEFVAVVLGQLPDDSIALAELAVMANHRALETHLQLTQRDPGVTAHLLNRLARRLRQMGLTDQALQAITTATQIYGRLAQTDSDAYLPNLLGCLHIRAVCLAEVGQAATALQVGQAAVDGYRVLAQARPEAYQSELANSLTALANRFKAVGRKQPAVAAALEATQIYLSLWDNGRRTTVMPDLARALNNLAVHTNSTGSHEAALDMLDDAIDLRRRLAEHRPDAYLPDLASSLNNRANVLDDLERYTEANAPITETVEIYRRLAGLRPGAYLHDLAMALNNLAINWTALSRTDEALAANAESVDLYRALSARQPEAHRPDLAMALSNLGSRLGRVDRNDEAVAALAEAVEIRRELTGRDPQRYAPGLAISLSNLAVRLGAAGHNEASVAAAEEAVQLCRDRSSEDQTFTEYLAAALNTLANACARTGDRSAGERAATEAIHVYRQLRAGQPTHFSRPLANAMTTCAKVVAKHDPDRAIALLNDALELCDGRADSDLAQEIITRMLELRAP